MSLTTSSREEAAIPGKKIKFDDFDISWVGENPSEVGYCLGSDDGRIRTLGIDGRILTSPSISLLRDAINEVAFSGRVMAASTRSEVAFIFREDNGDSLLRYEGGAHGLITISSGGFLAPLGRNGLLMMVPLDGPNQAIGKANLDSRSGNLYKLAHCNGDGRNDLIVGAARRDGMLIMGLETLSDRVVPRYSQFIRSPDLDVIDVTSLGSSEWPNAVAWLGADCSIHMSRDVLKERSSKSLRIKELQGSAYSLLHAQGHLFLLTSKALYIFPDTAKRYLTTNSIGHLAAAISMKIDLVEIYISKDNLILLHSDHVTVISIQEITSEEGGSNTGGWSPQFAEELLLNSSTESTWILTPVV